MERTNPTLLATDEIDWPAFVAVLKALSSSKDADELADQVSINLSPPGRSSSRHLLVLDGRASSLSSTVFGVDGDDVDEFSSLRAQFD